MSKFVTLHGFSGGNKNPELQDKIVTPTTSQQSITADDEYDGLGIVTVEAMPTATQATPTISVDSSGLITASASQSTGYVEGGTKSISSQLTTKGSTTITPSTSEQTAVASGVYTTGEIKVAAMPTATQATPSISVDSAGKITASATQTAGYVSSGTKSSTKQLTVQAAQTITPGTSNKTIAAGTYLTGTQTIAGDADLKAGNIKKGVNIFGINGTYTDLNFTVVGGTSAPSNPAANTIWINTSTSITSWEFISTTPTWTSSNGKIYIVYEPSTNNKTADFDAIGTNAIWINPIAVYQYVNNTWVKKTAKIYKNSQWVDWNTYLIRGSDLCEGVTGGWTAIAKPFNATAGGSEIPTVIQNSDSITVKLTSSSWCNGMYYVNNRIDLTNKRTLHVTAHQDTNVADNGGSAALGIFSSLGTYASENRVASVVFGWYKETYDIDVSSLTGTYVIAINLLSSGSIAASGTIYEIEIE